MLLPAERSFLPESLLSIPAPVEPVSLFVEEPVVVPGLGEPIELFAGEFPLLPEPLLPLVPTCAAPLPLWL
jgi:hypothetical protein